MSKKKLVNALYDIGAFQFGTFQLKSGIESPIYVDLRLIVSYPNLLQEISEAIWTLAPQSVDLLCGVPYTALPIASYLSVAHNTPMVIRRKESKGYGNKKIIEGAYQPGNRCLVIEDLITSGASIFETIHPLEEQKIQVDTIVSFLDREQGGKRRIEQEGYSFQSVITISEALDILQKEGKLSSEDQKRTKEFIAQHQF